MTNSEELEYRLQKLEATVEQMKKDSFWSKGQQKPATLQQMWSKRIGEELVKGISDTKKSPISDYVQGIIATQLENAYITYNKCLWDYISEEDKKKPMMLSCPCPKCNATC